MTKRCPRCGETKQITKFGRDKYTADGVNAWCKECRREESKKIRRRYAERNEAKR